MAHRQRHTWQSVGARVLGVVGLLALATFTLQGQEAGKKDPASLLEDRAAGTYDLPPSIELAGYTRPGNPSDTLTDEGKILQANFAEGKNVKKFKVLGATIYFAVFKNVGGANGDTYGTGMAGFDSRFDAGRSDTDAYAPTFDKKAKYLYTYMIVNDRFLNPHVVKEAAGQKDGDKIRNPLFDPNVKDALTSTIQEIEPIQKFALKLLVDPRYITSWGHFIDSTYASNVVDTDVAGNPVKLVVDDGKNKTEKERIIPMAFTYLPPIVNSLPHPGYNERAKPFSLGKLANGFGVANSSLNIKNSKSHENLKEVAGKLDKSNVKWIAFMDQILKSADAGRTPDFVEVLYPELDPNNPDDPARSRQPDRTWRDELAYCVFRARWLPKRSIKQGERSVLVGFTTDLPPVFAPVRADSPKAGEVGKELELSGDEEEIGPPKKKVAAPGKGAFFTAFYNGEAIDFNNAENSELFTQAGGGGGGRSAHGTVPTPTPPPPAGGGGGGGGGITSGGNPGLGGGAGSGGGFGGFGFPGFGNGGGLSRGAGSGSGGGIGSGGGSGEGEGTADQSQRVRDAINNNNTINFNATLTNQQQQSQQQQQFQQQQQSQKQNQNQHQNQHQNGGGNGNGHVIPAPASLLLGLLGLPALFFLRRRKSDATPETAEATA